MRLYEILNIITNKNFQSWFKGSKVVDDEGKPLKFIMEHFPILKHLIKNFSV